MEHQAYTDAAAECPTIYTDATKKTDKFAVMLLEDVTPSI